MVRPVSMMRPWFVTAFNHFLSGGREPVNSTASGKANSRNPSTAVGAIAPAEDPRLPMPGTQLVRRYGVRRVHLDGGVAIRQEPDEGRRDHFDGPRRHRHRAPALRRPASNEDLDAGLGSQLSRRARTGSRRSQAIDMAVSSAIETERPSAASSGPRRRTAWRIRQVPKLFPYGRRYGRNLR